MQKDIFEKIASFLLGASWAIVLLGALIVFKTFLILGLALSLFLTLLYIFLSLFLVLLLDSFLVNKERLAEAKKQTELLEKIYTKET
jgi:voltage-gated potassium channel Kch